MRERNFRQIPAAKCSIRRIGAGVSHYPRTPLEQANDAVEIVRQVRHFLRIDLGRQILFVEAA